MSHCCVLCALHRCMSYVHECEYVHVLSGPEDCLTDTYTCICIHRCMSYVHECEYVHVLSGFVHL